MKTPILASTTLAAAALVALTGCTGAGGTDADKSTKPSASSSKAPSSISTDWPAPRDTPTPINIPAEKVDVPCTDGQAVIADHEAEFTLADDCDVVRVLPSATASVVRLNASVNHLVVDSDLVGIYGNRIDDVVVSGNANDIVYTGKKPTVDDTGKNNNITDHKA